MNRFERWVRPRHRIAGRYRNVCGGAALAVIATPALVSAFAIEWWTIDGGGVVETTNGPGYVLSGTIGQPEVGQRMIGGAYEVQGGFWTGGLSVTSDVPGQGPGDGGGAGTSGLAFRAHGSAPNPFRAQATLSFELPSREPVHLAIYDPRGRLCRELVDGEMEAGKHATVWDGRDGEGRELPSGIYFAVLRSPAGDHRQKLIKVR